MDWENAKKHLYNLKEAYEEIGTVGAFGLVFINGCIERFEKGERTQDLYERIMELEL